MREKPPSPRTSPSPNIQGPSTSVMFQGIQCTEAYRDGERNNLLYLNPTAPKKEVAQPAWLSS